MVVPPVRWTDNSVMSIHGSSAMEQQFSLLCLYYVSSPFFGKSIFGNFSPWLSPPGPCLAPYPGLCRRMQQGKSQARVRTANPPWVRPLPTRTSDTPTLTPIDRPPLNVRPLLCGTLNIISSRRCSVLVYSRELQTPEVERRHV